MRGVTAQQADLFPGLNSALFLDLCHRAITRTLNPSAWLAATISSKMSP